MRFCIVGNLSASLWGARTTRFRRPHHGRSSTGPSASTASPPHVRDVRDRPSAGEAGCPGSLLIFGKLQGKYFCCPNLTRLVRLILQGKFRSCAHEKSCSLQARPGATRRHRSDPARAGKSTGSGYFTPVFVGPYCSAACGGRLTSRQPLCSCHIGDNERFRGSCAEARLVVDYQRGSQAEAGRSSRSRSSHLPAQAR